MAGAAAMVLFGATQNEVFLLAAWVGFYINLFNLIPIGMFDGAKIFRWSWRIWLATVVVAGLLFVYALV